MDEFYVVSGYNGEQVRRFLDDLALRCTIKITHVVNNDWQDGNGLSVLAAKEHLVEPFVLLMADHLFDPSILHDLAPRTPSDGEITLAVDYNIANPLVDLEDVTRVRSENERLMDIGKGLEQFDCFDTGIFLCTPAIFDCLKQSIVDRQDSSLSGGVRCLAAQGRAQVFDIGGRFWCDTDSPQDLDNAENTLVNRLRGKTSDGPVSRYLNRPLSIRISSRLARFPITPNQISLISFLLCVAAAWLFAIGGYVTLALGGLTAQFASIIDGCDGEIARLKFLKSDFGGWFDAVLDRYADALLLFGLTWHAHTASPLRDVLVTFIGNSGSSVVLTMGFLAIIGSFMNSYTADKYDSLMKATFSKGKGIRIGRDVRICLIFVCAVCNLPFVTLIVLAVLMNVETVRRVVVCYRHEQH
jgi:CDP-L-myo-inositol myo-inositolphosphotransferase